MAHLIELAENLFDQIKFPQASTQMRTFTEKSQKTVQPPEKKKSAEELEKERGIDDRLAAILSSENILKIGAAVNDDVRGLQRYKDFKAGGFVDLQKIVCFDAMSAAVTLTRPFSSGLVVSYRISRHLQNTL